MPMDESPNKEFPADGSLRSRLPQSPSTILREDWQQKAEEELNETPENYKQKTSSLREFILKDKNLQVPDDQEFLLRFLRARKFDSQKAFSMLQRYYLMKLKCPELFSCPLPSENSKVFELQAQNMLPQRDQLGRRVYIIRVDYFDSSRVTVEEIFRTNILALEQIVREPETQVAGIVVVLDMSGLNLQHVKFFTPYYAKKMVELVQETFPLRFKGFHIVNEPFYFDAVMAIVKPFLKDKIRKRVFFGSPRITIRYSTPNFNPEPHLKSICAETSLCLNLSLRIILAYCNTFRCGTLSNIYPYFQALIYLHGSDIASMHAFLPRDILPLEYGGTAGKFDNRPWHMQLLADEDYFKNYQNYGYKTDC